LEDLLPFRYLIKNGVITLKDLETKTFDELQTILQISEIPAYEEYVICKNNEKRNSLKK